MRPFNAPRLTRRSLLTALAGAAGAAALPLIPRRAAAATPFQALAGRARHVLILNAAGGLRTAPLFFANTTTAHNPYGEASSQGASEWRAGALLESPRSVLSTFSANTRLTSAADLSGDIAVLAGVDHDPTGPAMVDHFEATRRLATIATADGTAGLLAIIHREHRGYREHTIALPPIDIGTSIFAEATGTYATSRPLEIRSAEVFRGRSGTAEPARRAAWMLDLQADRDRRIASRSPKHAKIELDARSAAKLGARTYGEHLRNPALDLLEAPDANLGGLTNLNILEALGAIAPNTTRWGLEVGFALRCFQLGIPAVTITRDLFDTHSDERDTLPTDAADLARQISGIHFLLKRMHDSDGTPLWDNTVVVVVSEFNRDNTDLETGFNFGGGSDHRGTPASRNQIWPIFGGPLRAKGRMIGRLDPASLATIDRPATSVHSVMATLLALLGIDPQPYYRAAPLTELFT